MPRKYHTLEMRLKTLPMQKYPTLFKRISEPHKYVDFMGAKEMGMGVIVTLGARHNDVSST